MKYQHLRKEERYSLEILLGEKHSLRKIAQMMGRNVSSISRELKRNSKQKQYSSAWSQEQSRQRLRRGRRRKRLKDEYVRLRIEELIRCGLSPEQIAGRLKLEGRTIISPSAIYNWIHTEKAYLEWYLPRGHKQCSKKKRKKGTGEKLEGKVNISEREAGRRRGDWEVDLIESAKGYSEVLQTCVDRGSRRVILNKLRGKTKEESSGSLIRNMRGKCESITYDHGRENYDHEKVNAALGTKSFFCTAYHSWEKGSVEQTNGVIRRYVPKGSNIGLLTEEAVKKIERSLNNRPMKCLGWLTPIEEEEGYKYEKLEQIAERMTHPMEIREMLKNAKLKKEQTI